MTSPGKGRASRVTPVTRSRRRSECGEPRQQTLTGCSRSQATSASACACAPRSTALRGLSSAWLDANGAALAEIANQLGHADTNVTANYLGRTGAPTRAAQVMVLPTPAPLLRAV